MYGIILLFDSYHLCLATRYAAPEINPFQKLSPFKALKTPLDKPCAPALNSSCPKVPTPLKIEPIP